jgi:hypothetical protein
MSPCKRKNTKLITNPSKPGARGENATYLRLEKPRFLFLEGSVRAVVAPVVAAAVLVDELAALADASAARTASSTGCPAAGAPAPVPRPPPLKGPAPRRSPPPPPVTMSSRESPGGSPCCSRSRYSSLSYSRRSRHWILVSFLRAASSCTRRCAVRAAAWARGVGGSDCAASTVTLC